MPPKKRKTSAAATTADPEAPKARATRGNAPAAESAPRRSKRDDAATAANKTKGSGASAPATTEAAPAPAKGRRGRQPRQMEDNKEAEQTVEKTVALAPKKKKGRPAKQAVPVPEPEPEPEPAAEKEAPKRGRGRGAKSAASVPAAVEDEPQEKAPKRGRGKAAKAAASIPVEEQAPKTPSKRTRRGADALAIAEGAVVSRRHKRASTLTSKEQPPAKAPEPRKKSRQPPSKATFQAAEELPEPLKKRGRAAKTAEESTAEKPPKKRGRTASKAAEEPDEPPKKRGRTASKVATEEAPEAPKKRGKAASKAAEPAEAPSATASRKRGAKATKATEETTTEATPKRRGRPPKSHPIVMISPPGERTGAKRGRPKKDAEEIEEPAPKRRGRKPKAEADVPAAKAAKETKVPKAATKTDEAAEKPKQATKAVAKPKADVETKAADKSVKPRGRKAKAAKISQGSTEGAEDEATHGHAYWLMKAEPESRLEKGVDVKFSIDDLAAATAPEPWDGVRNHVAKKNMMAMKKGDLAFFYHSNCKTPGIVGIMEIVEEAQPDQSAFDPFHPYYDEKSKRDKPTWFCVKVAFRSKFTNPESVNLETIKTLANEGGVLANIQLIKQSRLSVSKVTKKEWDYILAVAGEQEPERTEAPKEDTPTAKKPVVDEAIVSVTEPKLAPKEIDRASTPSEPEEAKSDDDTLGLTIGTPKGAAALLAADGSPSPIGSDGNAETTLVIQEETSVQDNGVTTTFTETIVEKVPSRATSRQPSTVPADVTTDLVAPIAAQSSPRPPSRAASRQPSIPPTTTGLTPSSAVKRGNSRTPSVARSAQHSSRAPSVSRSVRAGSAPRSVRGGSVIEGDQTVAGEQTFARDHTFAGLGTTLEVDEMSFKTTGGAEPATEHPGDQDAAEPAHAAFGDTSLFAEGHSEPFQSIKQPGAESTLGLELSPAEEAARRAALEQFL